MAVWAGALLKTRSHHLVSNSTNLRLYSTEPPIVRFYLRIPLRLRLCVPRTLSISPESWFLRFFFLSPESGCFQFWCKLAMDHEPYDSSGEFHFKVPFFLPVSASFNSFLILGLGLCLGFFVFNSSFYGLLGSVV